MDKDALIAIILPDGRVYDITDNPAAAAAAQEYLADRFHPCRVYALMFPGAAQRLLDGDKAWNVVFEWFGQNGLRCKRIDEYYGVNEGWNLTNRDDTIIVRVWAKDESSAIEKAKQMLRNDGLTIDETEETKEAKEAKEAGGQEET